MKIKLSHNYSSYALFVYDGGCPFCNHFAELCELRSGINGFEICDGRADKKLRDELKSQGLNLRDGAILLVGDHAFHGAEAIQWVSQQMDPSSQVLYVMKTMMSSSFSSKILYPFLQLARLFALSYMKLPLDPD